MVDRAPSAREKSIKTDERYRPRRRHLVSGNREHARETADAPLTVPVAKVWCDGRSGLCEERGRGHHFVLQYGAPKGRCEMLGLKRVGRDLGLGSLI
ncbi:hypothetical protein SCP_0900110 [Sparassis crispa]|uniref:Uncharacterized protein n=1 Tax=Sparassis crispa TaxID=139825 RepID=A0A401GWJ1_9APHY|nr:hypothetical protein SCP_0900110 [Sparassis crispa]GBE86134.1 hypothetical protein SCP_0900110 [Sparassis crispa]